LARCSFPLAADPSLGYSHRVLDRPAERIMRRNAWLGLFAALFLIVGPGCWHASKKYDTSVPHVEEFNAPPKEARYNNPPESGYKKPPPKKEFRPGAAEGGPGGGAGGPLQ